MNINIRLNGKLWELNIEKNRERVKSTYLAYLTGFKLLKMSDHAGNVNALTVWTKSIMAIKMHILGEFDLFPDLLFIFFIFILAAK